MIIGLTGPNGSGKGEVARYLESKGFTYLSLSDVVREEAARRGLEATRKNLIRIGNDLRRHYGPAILAKRIRKKISNKTVVDSIRNPHEVEELKKEKDFFLISIEAPLELRFQRCLERGRIGDARTLEEFQMREEIENSEDASCQQIEECMKRADHVIMNKGTMEELYKKVQDLLSRLHPHS